MAIKDAPMVDIIEFDEKEAYNPDRPISSLVRTQLLHLHHAEHLALPLIARTNININTLHTERQASEYIQRITALLHEHGARAAKKQTPPKKRTSAKKKSSPKKPATVSKRSRKPAKKNRR
jgi:hypothetical protein